MSTIISFYTDFKEDATIIMFGRVCKHKYMIECTNQF